MAFILLFLPELLSGGYFRPDLVVAWIDDLHQAASISFGLIMLLSMAAAVAVALWQAVYRFVLAWLGTR